MELKTWFYIAIPVVLLYLWYVNIIKKRNRAREALSGTDVQLKMRFDLIPNILKIAQKFMEHEKTLMSNIVSLRTLATTNYNLNDKDEIAKHLTAVNQLGSKMSQLMVAVENYPDLKSNQTMLEAMQTYNEVEEQIAAARRFYNSAVTELNNSVQIFPGNILALLVRVSAMPFYEGEEITKVSINSSDYLK